MKQYWIIDEPCVIGEFLLRHGISQKAIKAIKMKGEILVDGKHQTVRYLLQVGETLTIIYPPEDNHMVPVEIPLKIVYEDQDVIVVNKPSGMIVHPSAGIYSGTLVNALLYHCQDLSGINGVMRPGIVHRIDKETSGLLMVAKNDKAHKSLSEQLKEHSVTRRYVALVHGVIPHVHGKVNAPIGRDVNDRQKMAVTATNSKNAVTHFKVIERFKDYTLVECELETGRTHQIRVHLSHIGYPIVGDYTYSNGKNEFGVVGQCLHAKCLEFKHPITGAEMKLEAPLPKYFEEIIQKLDNE